MCVILLAVELQFVQRDGTISERLVLLDARGHLIDDRIEVGVLELGRNKWTLAIVVVLSAVVLVEYYPALSAGFVTDDWWFVTLLLTKSLPDYLIQAFDPRGQFIYYRPIAGSLLLIKYALFGTNAMGYYLVSLLIHLGNSLLIFGLVNRIIRSVRVGFVAAMVFAAMPPIGMAVLWQSDPQPLATLFYLLSIWLWFSYLQTESRVKYILAFSFAALSIFTKGTSITLPIVLFLIDRFFVRNPVSPAGLIRRYLAFALVLPLYLVPLQSLLTQGGHTGQMALGPELHVVTNFIQYLAVLSFPWETVSFAHYLWLPVAALLFLGIAIRKRSRGLALLGLSIPIVLLPYLFSLLVDVRYLYSPVIIVAILVGLAFEMARRTIRPDWFRPALALPLSLLILGNAASIAEYAGFWADSSRLERLTFHTIAVRHPTFPEGTYLYFINGADQAWSTMALIRYGNRVWVSGINTPLEARLRDHSNPIVIYMDAQGEPREIPVDKQVATRTIPDLPVEFEGSIRLENYELTRQRVKRGEMLGLILYWRTTKKMDKDYTVFVHLIDEDGRVIEGVDSQPQDGNRPTSSWQEGELVPDGRVFPIPEDAPLGDNLRLEIGLYYLPTMQRLSIVNSSGAPFDDKLVIEPVAVTE